MSKDEYNLGYGNQVVPLFQPESPPPPLPTYISSSDADELDHMKQDWTWSSSLQRMGRSLDCDLPQHVAEKFSKNIFSCLQQVQQGEGE